MVVGTTPSHCGPATTTSCAFTTPSSSTSAGGAAGSPRDVATFAAGPEPPAIAPVIVTTDADALPAVAALLVSPKRAEAAAPAALALTVYLPAIASAVAVTDATPSLPMVTVSLESVADAPLDGTLKLTIPPVTGSIASFAVTVTANALGKAEPTGIDCGVLSETTVRVNPWLWKAPMSRLVAGRATPRWSVVKLLMAVPAPMAGLPGSRGMVFVCPP
jgi:hypothetical protein